MNKILLLLILAFSLMGSSVFSQSSQNDIDLKDLPEDVKTVLNSYVKILSKSKDLKECVLKAKEVLGGALMNSSGTDLHSDTKEFSLKKDFINIKFYQIPVNITRVNKKENAYDGYEKTLIEGDIYKIWIDKKKSTAGMPAPISIIKPKTGKPKVVGIGSL